MWYFQIGGIKMKYRIVYTYMGEVHRTFVYARTKQELADRLELIRKHYPDAHLER